MILRYVIEAIAITIVFTKGSIFERIRTAGPKLWQELARCPLCAGVWIGMIWRVLRARPDVLTWTTAGDVLASGAATGVSALGLALFIACLDRWSDPDYGAPK